MILIKYVPSKVSTMTTLIPFALLLLNILELPSREKRTSPSLRRGMRK